MGCSIPDNFPLNNIESNFLGILICFQETPDDHYAILEEKDKIKWAIIWNESYLNKIKGGLIWVKTSHFVYIPPTSLTLLREDFGIYLELMLSEKINFLGFFFDSLPVKTDFGTFHVIFLLFFYFFLLIELFNNFKIK